jgi:hypothetical protein
MFKKLKQGI